ncbi:alpha/beta hydrolase [Hyunsoonleella aquatilis]|uniref:alpha/beta hydrolase n=1 Tax=Hyunsoonleella aquatilis TaxID=2762758 RepID=UPI001C994E69|nr:alpha/beta hydrolase [Hyunsoonleella aquatilis]
MFDWPIYLRRNLFLLFVFGCSLLGVSQNKRSYTYAKKDSKKLRLDVYTPEHLKKGESLPVVIWMHGGSFSGGERDGATETRFMKYLTKNGYIGVSISYRLLLKGSKTGFGCNCPASLKKEVFRQATMDFLDATKYIVARKKKLRIDIDKIIAGGSSAGAEVVLHAVYLKRFLLDDVKTYAKVNFAGVFALAGAVMDTSYISEDNAVPAVLFHGTEDKLVPFGEAPHRYCSEDDSGFLVLNGSESIANRLHQLNQSYYLHKVIGGGHEVNHIPYDELDAVLEFFEKTLGSGETIQTVRSVKK